MRPLVKKILLTVASLALLGGAFYGGVLYSGTAQSGPGDMAAQGRGNMNSAFSELSSDEIQEFQNMTDEEREAFAEEQGIDLSAMPSGGMTSDGSTRPSRGGLLEGEVVDAATDSITIALEDGGSQTIYIDDDTVIAYADGATELADGSDVLLYSESETDGVTTAQVIVVR